MAIRDRLFRESVASLLRTQRDFRILGQAASWQDAWTFCEHLQSHVLLLDAKLAGSAVAMRIAAFRAHFPSSQVLALAPLDVCPCGSVEPPPGTEESPLQWSAKWNCLEAAILQGALGAINANATSEDLFDAVRAVAAGHAWVARDILLTEVHDRILSDRERAVAIGVASGMSNKEIAASLTIAEPTVKKHLTSILHRLHIHSRLQLGLCVMHHPASFFAAPEAGVGRESMAEGINRHPGRNPAAVIPEPGISEPVPIRAHPGSPRRFLDADDSRAPRRLRNPSG